MTILDYRDIARRKDFDPNCDITPATFGSLIDEYHLSGDEEFPCQVANDGERCDEPHKNGWLARRKDNGKEALIGNRCGPKYFFECAEFIAGRKRIRRESNIEGYLQRLNLTKGRPEYASELERTLDRLKAIQREVEDLQRRIPSAINRRLENMAKSGNASVVVLFEYEDEDDEGNPKTDWVPGTVGTIVGTPLWEVANIRNAFKRLHLVRDALRDAQISRDAGERRLKAWADALDDLPFCTSQIADFESALEGFSETANLQVVCFLVPNRKDSLAITRMIIQRGSTPDPDGAAARNLFDELSASIRATAGGRPFRIE